MKKIAILLVVACMAGIALGVTTITYNVPDVFGVKLLAALMAQADAHVSIEIRGDRDSSEPGDEYSTRVHFRTPAKPAGMTNAVFVKKTIGLYASALEKAHQKWLYREIRIAYDANAPVEDIGVPDPNELN